MGEDAVTDAGAGTRRATELVEERLCRVTTAHLALIDEEAILCDFPRARDGDAAQAAQIDLGDWLVDQAGLIAEAQLAPNSVNTKVHASGDMRAGYRPARYGRASIVPVVSPNVVSSAGKDTGSGRVEAAMPFPDRPPAHACVDVKGIGVAPDKDPSPGYHTTGLLRLDNALEEYLWARLIDQILVRSGAPARALPVYGVIDLGFDIRLEDIGVDAPAGLLVRKAHARPPLSDLPFARSRLQRLSLSVELLLRFYGITSSGDEVVVLEEDAEDSHRVSISGPPGLPPGIKLAKADIGVDAEQSFPLELDYCNIQTTLPERDGRVHLVDFGQFRWRERFNRPLMSVVADQPAAFGGIVWNDRADFPQPDPDQAIPESLWGTRRIAPGEEASAYLPDPQGAVRMPSLLCDRLVHAFRRGEIGPHDVKRRIDTVIEQSL